MPPGLANTLANVALAVLPTTRAFALKRWILCVLGFAIGPATRIAGGTGFYGGGTVRIGMDVWVGIKVSFYTIPGTNVIVEDNCDLAPNVVIHSGTHLMGSAIRRAGALHGDHIHIGRGTWIGTGAIVLAGARIGAGSVVAAGALVQAGTYKDNVLLAGVPARVVRDLPEE